MPVEAPRASAPNAVSAKIIAAGIVIAFCYWASTILVTLLVSVLIAYFLDPLVSWLEAIRIPRALGSLITVLLTLTLVAFLGWTLIERLDQFGADWPQYRAPLKATSEMITARVDRFEARVSEIEPLSKPGPRVVTVTEPHPVRTALVGRLSSVYAFILAATFVPFLLFFMLAAKQQVWHATMELFPLTKRTEVKEALAEVTQVLRSYLVGTALVGVILVLASWLFFWLLGIDFPFLTALVSGVCNMIPYLGAVLSWIPPFLVGLKQYHALSPFLGIFAVLTALHILTANLLIPALVGWRIRLNALALTVSLLFWGWLWGAMGLVLAIPITAVLKVICDHMEGWEPIGRWLGSGER